MEELLANATALWEMIEKSSAASSEAMEALAEGVIQPQQVLHKNRSLHTYKHAFIYR